MRNIKLPKFFQSILWWYAIDDLDIDNDIRTIVVQTINYGMWHHWQWIVKNYGKHKIKQLIKGIPASEFRPEALALAAAIFGIKEMKYASRSAYIRAQRTLAKD